MAEGREPAGRSERVATLFAAALELPPDDRETFVRDEAGERPEIAAEVLRLLGAHDAADGFLQTGIAERAAGLVELTDDPASRGDIAGYTLRGELGRGGMGVVYLAERRVEDVIQRVALKVVRGGPVSDDVRRRFEQERRILAGLEHPGVARLLDAGVTDQGTPFFAMELVEGEEVTEFGDRREATVEVRLRLFVEICRTVQYAHRNLVVHRDLKPSNILVTSDGVPKLLDFGIAKLLGTESETGPAPTRQGLQALTPDFAAPEQVRGEAVTTATDVYALGVLLYRLLSGRAPYEIRTSSLQAIVEAVCETEPSPPSMAVARPPRSAEDGSVPSATEVAAQRSTTPGRLERRLTGDLDTIVRKALRKNPAERYPSAEALADDLERHLDGLPVRARPDTFAYRSSKFLARHRLAVASGFLVVLSLVAGLAGTTWQARVAANERERAEEQLRRAEEARTEAEEVSRFLIDLFEASSPDKALGTTPTAREVLERGAEEIRRRLADQPATRARLMVEISEVYLLLGLTEQAEDLIRESLEIRREILDPLDPELARSHHHLGIVQYRLGELDAAEGSYRRALEILERADEGDPALLARALTNLGVLVRGRGDADAALGLYRRALAIQERGPGPPGHEVADTLVKMAVLLDQGGDPAAAEPLFVRALAIQRERLDPRSPEIASTLTNLGVLYLGQERLDEAEGLLREALAIQERVLGDEHPYLASTLNTLGDLHRRRGELEAAERALRRALEIDRGVHGAEHPNTAISLTNLADVLREAGRPEEARTVYREALEIFETMLEPEHLYVSYPLQGLALLQLPGDPRAAADGLRRALEIRRRTLPDDHEEVRVLQEQLASVDE